MRLFYNKPLFREATGLAAPLHDFRKFIAACEQIKTYGRAHGRTLLPVVDVNDDSEISGEECAIALVGGTVIRGSRCSASA